MKNKIKGFTLIELLAVIVVLAIIMVIAVTSVTKTSKKAANSAFMASYKIILNNVKRNIDSKVLNLTDTSDIVCETTKECSEIYDISEDSYKMTILYDDSDDSYIVSVMGIGNFNSIELSDFSDDKMACNGKTCTTKIKNGVLSKYTENSDRHIYEVKYSFYNQKIAKENGIIDNIKDIVLNKNGDIATNMDEYSNKLGDKVNVRYDKYDNDLKVHVVEIEIKDSELGYLGYYSFHDDGMEHVCMPNYNPKTDGDNTTSHYYYIAINEDGELVDYEPYAEQGLCNLPG